MVKVNINFRTAAQIVLMTLIMSLIGSTADAKRNKKFKVENIQGVTLIDCHDGDTCNFLNNGRKIKVRFSGIDAPEIKQQDGTVSRDFLLQTLRASKSIDLSCLGRSYHRKVCVVTADGKDAGELMVNNGFAWDAPKYSKGKYRALQEAAMKGKMGIWKGKPIEPNCFRHPSKC
jgi:micrococcal nuclease